MSDVNISEVWKDIKGYEGLYQVSDIGRVKSLERTVSARSGSKRTIRERILKSEVDKYGYEKVGLSNSGKTKTFPVHRLVCKAFHKNPENKPEVNHINENKLDNRACNLEWVTSKENCNHGTRIARIAKGVKKAFSKPIAQYTSDGELIKIWQSTREVERLLGFDHRAISNVALGKQKTAYGYVWKYIEVEK